MTSFQFLLLLVCVAPVGLLALRRTRAWWLAGAAMFGCAVVVLARFDWSPDEEEHGGGPALLPDAPFVGAGALLLFAYGCVLLWLGHRARCANRRARS